MNFRDKVAMIRMAIQMSLPDAYQFMGLNPNSTPDEVKRQYRALSLRLHPDRGGDPEEMKKLNVARDIIERGVGTDRSTRTSPRYESRSDNLDRRYYNMHMKMYPPTGRYTDRDLQEFAGKVVQLGYLQMIVRQEVDSPSFGSKHGPFGSKKSTKRIKGSNPEREIYSMLKTVPGEIWDINETRWELSVTFREVPDAGKSTRFRYRSISFQKPKEAVKKAPGVGMTPAEISAYFRENGFDVVAGGSKFSYWGPRGTREKEGAFIREAGRTLRPVIRSKGYSGIEDIGVIQPVAFGKVSRDMLDRFMNWVKSKRR